MKIQAFFPASQYESGKLVDRNNLEGWRSWFRVEGMAPHIFFTDIFSPVAVALIRWESQDEAGDKTATFKLIHKPTGNTVATRNITVAMKGDQPATMITELLRWRVEKTGEYTLRMELDGTSEASDWPIEIITHPAQ